MDTEQSAPRGLLRRLLGSWKFYATIVVMAVVAFFVAPHRVVEIVTADGEFRWDEDVAPPRREIVWQPAVPVETPEPRMGSKDHHIRPQFAENGTVLYFTRRQSKGKADIYRSVYSGGKWQEAEPVAELNSRADDIGPVIRRDGRRLYLYSNRKGGYGNFDLYVSDRTADGWSAPRNLGPKINSPAREYDPAVSADGRRLFFSSNRSPAMHRRIAQGKTGKPGDEWDTTMRADLGQRKFDLYAADRENAQEEWPTAEPIAELNRGDTNEGAPYVSPTGAFLYFVSDRPLPKNTGRQDEPINCDIYRVRISPDRFREMENLGPGVNTSANEIEPALSAEDFRLIFSRNRQANPDKPGQEEVYDLYCSTAIEVEEDHDWRDGPWAAIPSFLLQNWWWMLLIALLAALLLALAWFVREMSVRRAPVPGFLVMALLLHFMLGAGSFFVYFGEGIIETIQTKLHEIAVATHLSSEDLHQSHKAGEKSYEKVADLKSVERVRTADVARQVARMPNVPIPTTSPAPEIPERLTRKLPIDRIVATIEVTERVPTDSPQLERQRFLTELTIDDVRIETEQNEAAPAPDDSLPKPEQVAMDVPRRQPMPEVREIPKISQPDVSTQTQPKPAWDALPRGPTGDPAPAPAPAPVDRPESLTRIAPAQVASPESLQVTPEKVDTPAIGVAPGEQPIALAMNLPRRPWTQTTGNTELPSHRANVESSAKPSVHTVADATTDRPDREPVAPSTKQRPDLIGRATRAVVQVADVSPVALQVVDASQPSKSSAGEVTVDELPVNFQRGKVQLLPVRLDTADRIGGPHDPSRHDLVLGSLTKQNVDAPLTTSPIASRILRRPALAPRLLYGEDNVGLQSMLRRRRLTAAEKEEVVTKFGGGKKTLQAVSRGLSWLAAHQHSDGHWGLHDFHTQCKGHQCNGAGGEHSDTAATGFALLAMLGDGHTHAEGSHRATVDKGVRWLIDRQKDDGDLFTSGGGNSQMYSHAIAAIALCEVYGMSGDPKLRQPAQKAVDFIVSAQHDQGGWRYRPRQPGDTSVFGWQIMALKSAQIAGLTVPQPTLDRAKTWLQGPQKQKGRFGYMPNAGPTPTMTAEALLCLQYMGANRNHADLQAGAAYLLENLPVPGKETSYYWYYATQVMYHMGGEHWRRWNEAEHDMLIQTQVTTGPMTGTWDPKDQWESKGGRIYSTALRILMLEVSLRHLPLYEVLKPGS